MYNVKLLLRLVYLQQNVRKTKHINCDSVMCKTSLFKSNKYTKEFPQSKCMQNFKFCFIQQTDFLTTTSKTVDRSILFHVKWIVPVY